MLEWSARNIAVVTVTVIATCVMTSGRASAQVPHRINTYTANRGQADRSPGAWDLGRERSADHSTWGWPEADPGTIELDGVPAVLDVPYGLPTPPALPGGDSSYNALPEPGSAVLLGLAAALALRRRR